MSIKKLMIISAVMVSILTSLTACGKKVETPAKQAVQNLAPLPIVQTTGKPVGDKSLEGVNGESISLTSADNNVTVLALWAPDWFKDGGAQLEQLKKLHSEWSGRKLRVVLIGYEVTAQMLDKEIKKGNIPFEAGLGSKDLYSVLDVKSIPTIWFLDTDSNIITKLEGYQPYKVLEGTLEDISKQAEAQNN